MDGPWQMGHMPAVEYGRKARDTARQIRVIDRGLQLVACGSSGPNMPTYLVWDREVLEACYDQVDGISLHNYPYAWALQHASGRVLDLTVASETYPIAADGLRADVARNDQVPIVDIVATGNPQTGQACLLMLNRDLDSERDVVLDWHAGTPTRVLACETLTGSDLKAFNTFEQPTRVSPRPLDPPRPGARMTFKLPARSYTVVSLATS